MTIRFLHCTIQVRRAGPNPFPGFLVQRAPGLPVRDEPAKPPSDAAGGRHGGDIAALGRLEAEIYVAGPIRARTSVAAAWPAAVM